MQNYVPFTQSFHLAISCNVSISPFDMLFHLVLTFSCFSLLQKAVDGLLEGLSAMPADQEMMLRYRDCHLLVLKGLQDHRAYGPQWTNKHVTK